MNIDDLTIGQVKEIERMLGNNNNVGDVDAHLIGKPVLIRTYSAGVHIGKLQARRGREVRLSSTRRLWKWAGAFTLSSVAQNGVKSANVPDAQDEIVLLEAIEVIPMSVSAYQGLMEIESHEI